MAKEADFGILFRHWIKANPQSSAAFELKQTETDSIPFDCVTDEQLNFGLAITGDRGVLVRAEGVRGLPDYIYFRNDPSFIVIKYPKSFHIISVLAFIIEKERSKRKSLTLERARAISRINVDL